jgi:hypothetical protein
MHKGVMYFSANVVWLHKFRSYKSSNEISGQLFWAMPEGGPVGTAILWGHRYHPVSRFRQLLTRWENE